MSDMKCPFCGQELKRTNGTHNKVGVWQCQNYNDPDNVCIASGYLFNDDVLNYIIRTRKALEIAVDALKMVRKYTAINQFAPKSQEAYFVAKKALGQITAQQKE